MACPLCGGIRTREVLTVDGRSIRTCSTCTNAWTSPPPPKVPYDEQDFHAQFAVRSMADVPAQWRSGLIKQAEMLERHLGVGARVLEVGCGQGLLLAELKRRGMDVVGVEPSRTAAAIARERGLAVQTGFFPEASPAGPFDAVIMSHVLEHIEDPGTLLRAIHRVSPAGLLLLIQTNWRGLMPRLLAKEWYAWVPDHHYWHFTPQGLGMLLAQHGGEVVRVEHSSLEHGGRLLSRLALLLPGQADQFHLLARMRA